MIDTKEVKRNLFARKAKTLSVQFPVIKDVSIGFVAFKFRNFKKSNSSRPRQPYRFPLHVHGVQSHLLDVLQFLLIIIIKLPPHTHVTKQHVLFILECVILLTMAKQYAKPEMIIRDELIMVPDSRQDI